MTTNELSPNTVRHCQSAILEFLPPPVTDRDRTALKNYKAGNVRDLRADVIWGGDYAGALCALLNADQSDFDAVDCLNAATEQVVKCAGMADSSPVYKKLSEISPEHFNERGAS